MFRNDLVRANYKNSTLDVDYDYSYLEKFFQNLLTGGNNELKNRFMMINLPEGWKNEITTVQVQDIHRTSSEQVPNKQNDFVKENADMVKLLVVIGTQQITVKQMMEAMELKHRPTFLENYLNPAIIQGYVRLLYPDKPRHPRQKYLLTLEGLALYDEFKTTRL